MASREEEKRKRREERMAAEAAAHASQTRAKRLQFLLGALLTIVIVVGAVVLVTKGGGSGDGTKPRTTTGSSSATVPAPAERDLGKAAKAAGCVLLDPPIEGSTHVGNNKVTYKSNPPTSGNHNPVPALDGIYDPGQEPTPEHFVHALEHGRIDIQYRPGTSKHVVGQLETLASEPLNGKDAYKVLLFQNPTRMPYAVAATAWGHLIGCKTVTAATFDALRDFRVKYVDKGPEQGIPPNN